MNVDVWPMIPEFLAEIGIGRSAATQSKARSILERFQQFAQGEPPSRELVLKYLAKRRRSCKGTTLSLDRVYIKKFCEWLIDREILQRNPLRGLPSELCQKTEKPLISPEQYEQLKTVAARRESEIPMFYLLVLAWNTGHRLNDLCLLERKAVDLASRSLSFQPRKTRTRLANVTLPITDELLPVLKVQMAGHPETDQYVNHTLATLYLRNLGTTIHQQFKKVAIMAGLPQVTLHCFRHTRASRMSDAGVQDIDIAATLGISNLHVLRRYRRSNMETKLKGLSA